MTTLQEQYSAAWISGQLKVDGGEVGSANSQSLKFILLGGPGVGKGTQSDYLKREFGLLALSTGEIFRAANKMDKSQLSPAMIESFDYMSKGLLVPDDTVVKIVRERAFCLKAPMGFMLDGFPRTIPQAEQLDDILAQVNETLTGVLFYELSVEETVQRISGRRTCPKCKATFHMTNKPPKKVGICDCCGSELILREDDRPEAVKTRLAVYQESTAPLISFYEGKGLLIRVNAEGSPEDVFVRTKAILRSKGILK
ncbi:nucleoside monophosphate kinase [Candidatus Sumerlaeota bacterium]|nr:nucleoside monophosphate kinase [Candidatus Sumerlaeales bacterium]NLD62192.1 nucleoside monophosphate kinase [Candidatus Sumerlaeota bacterium]